MRLKPISASDALRGRQLLPPSHNRFEVFRNRNSSAASIRERSTSAKRKASDDGLSFSQPQVKKMASSDTPVFATVDLGKLELMNKNVANLYNISATLNEEVAKTKTDPELEAVLRSVCKFVDSSIALQEMIVDSISVSSKPQIPTIQVQDEASDSDMDTGPFFSSGPFSYSQMTAKRPIKKKNSHSVATGANYYAHRSQGKTVP